MPRRDLLQLRRGTAAQWVTANPVLAAAEAGFETDTGKLKYGDGATVWNGLDYFLPDATPDPDTTLLGNPISAAELATLDGVTAPVQSQFTAINSALALKAPIAHTHVIGDINALSTAYVVTDFDASGSKITTTGSINASSNQLTVASASTFAVDQGIYVNGAGAAGVHLISRITNIAGNVLTLADNASTTRSNVLVQHDDTVALQNALNEVVNAGGGRLLFPSGFYRVNGPLQSPSNSILTVPYIPIDGGTPVAISLEGQVPMQWGSYLGPESTQGVIIQSDVIGANSNSCIFAMAEWVPGATVEPFNNVGIYINDILFRTYDNPQLSGLDLGMAGFAGVERVHIDTGLLNGAEPTHEDYFGYRAPRKNTASAYSGCDMLVARNYWTGAILAESPLRPSNVSVARCKVGFEMSGQHYPLAGVFLAFQCPTSFWARSGAVYLDWTFYIEDALASDWAQPISGRHIYDPTNVMKGRIRYSIHETSSGDTKPLSMTGAVSVQLINLRA